ncbi:LPS assembly lipoprotein LptE [Schleiferiaceae bacterium]|nr:LPS assembly lipoprotein LptE [Schleiferiaceae bacterium]
MRIRWMSCFLVLFLSACSGGYSFTGGDVGEAKTLSIQRFDNNAPLVNPKLSQQFTETLQQVMVRQTPLSLVRVDGDLDFSGAITSYEVRSEAPSANDQVAQSRLSVTVRVNYLNHLDDSKNFEQSFSVYRNFPATSDLTSVEDALVDEIVQELAEKIFNRSLVNW